MALVTLPAVGISGFAASGSDGFVPRCWVSGFAQFCAVSTVPRAALAGISCTVLWFSIFVYEMEQVPDVRDARAPSYSKKEDGTYTWETLSKIFIEIFDGKLSAGKNGIGKL
jgi:hypothetical protein